MAISDKLENILNVKKNLQNIIDDYDITPSNLLSEIPNQIEDIFENIKSVMTYMDTIVVNSGTSLTQLNTLINYLPDASTKVVGTSMVTCNSGVNVRDSTSTSSTGYGKIGKGDKVPYFSNPSGSWFEINRFRYGDSYSNPLRTYSGHYYANITQHTTSTEYYPLCKLDISRLSSTIQNNCNYKLAESKGWIVIFGSGAGSSGSTEGTTSSSTVSYTFNNCYTDNYSNSSYSSKSSTNNTVVRQGYYNHYYKGVFAFTSSRKKEVKNFLASSNITKIEFYIKRTNSGHGSSAACPVYLYASSSSGSYSDTIVCNGAVSLKRGDYTWITITDNTVINRFKSGGYDQFKVYKASTSVSYYAIYDMVSKIRITYTV